jgi:hypothetical protein
MSFLSTLSAEQVRTVLSTLGPDLAIFAQSNIDMNGADLSKLHTSKLVKKSLYGSLQASGLERSMLAKEVRKLTTQMFEPILRAMFAPEGPQFQSRTPGPLDNPKWSTIDEAHCSVDGATGVIFVNTESGGYVVKASDAPASELFATELAFLLNIPAAKQRIVSRVERATIIGRLSSLSGAAAKAQHVTGAGDKDMLSIHVKLWSVFNQRSYVTAIALVPEASLLCGMAESSAELQLDPATENGSKRLRQIGELICFDAFLNNNDRIPVVHSNVGNGRNVMFSNGTKGDVIAIDQVVKCFSGELQRSKLEKESIGETKESIDITETTKNEVEGKPLLPSSSTNTNRQSLKSSMSSVSKKLYTEYVERVDSWLRQCLAYENATNEQKSFLRQNSVHAKLGKVPLQLCEEMKSKYGFDDRLAESVVRVSGFEAGTAHMIATHPLMLKYAQNRGPRICVAGSLLAVRDFIVRQCGYDIGENGVESIRQGVCICARKIAKLTKNDLEQLREEVATKMNNSEINDTSVDDWKEKVYSVVNINYLTNMQSLFSSAVKEIDPPPFHSSLRTKSGNSVYIDETTNRMYKFDHQTGKTNWISDDEEVSSDL